MKTALLAAACAVTGALNAQNYTSYFTGNPVDTVTVPTGGICLMGGATESDNAMRWFLERAAGGDILVLRASGSDGYNDYFYTELGVPVNSVESIVCTNAASADEAYIQQKIQQAEAIWFAGGDQWNYVSYWRNTAIDSLVNAALTERNIVIGGTSAGMAILGSHYFSAENGSVTSGTALANPYNSSVTPDSAAFLHNAFMENVITDTHYDDPDRKGRHVVFMARMVNDYGISARGIACDEYTAVCIAPDGIGHVYGDYPSSDDNAYFIRVNCAIADNTPETCQPGTPLTWNRNGMALMVYNAKGTVDGTQTFDLNTWESGTGGSWSYWSVTNGVRTETPGMQPDCSGLAIDEQTPGLRVFPNPSTGPVTVISDVPVARIAVRSANGALLLTVEQSATVSLGDLPAGLYFVAVTTGEKTAHFTISKID